MKQYLLFDLDGTLTDPKVGITTCVQYALQDFGIEEPDLDKLTPFIGPPLAESFKQFYGMNEEQAGRAVEKYRERFKDTGIFENEVYKGIPKMLKILKQKGFHLAVASSKPTVFVERILKHFKLDCYFEAVVGSELDGTRVNKDEVVCEVLQRLFRNRTVERDKVYMIGDRKFDAEGAKAMGIESVGVTYGYGSMEELREAHADYIVRSVEELTSFLLRETRENQPEPTLFQKVFAIFYQFALFMLVRSLTQYILLTLLSMVAMKLPESVRSFFMTMGIDGQTYYYTGNTKAIITAVSFTVAALFVLKIARYIIGRTRDYMYLLHLRREPKVNYVLLGTLTVGFVLGLNLFSELIRFAESSESYQQVAQSQYSAGLVLGLIAYGFIGPIAEEVLFRGIIYGYLRKFFGVKLGILINAVVFGAYHMNVVQGVYAFLMGLLFAYAYEYFGSFKVPVAMHITANVLAYVLTNVEVRGTFFVSWPVCVFFLALGIVSLVALMRQKRVF